MTLSPDTVREVQDSFKKLRGALESHSMVFYDALFKRAPELRAMFREDLTGQGMKFMTTLGVILDNLDNPGAIEGRYAELGHLHATLGVKAADFEPMGEALVDTMKAALGEDFTADMEMAWRVAYAEFSARMINRGGIT